MGQRHVKRVSDVAGGIATLGEVRLAARGEVRGGEVTGRSAFAARGGSNRLARFPASFSSSLLLLLLSIVGFSR